MSKMTIKDAILHAEEVAQKNRVNCKCNTISIPHTWISNIDCAEEHEQLAEWLKELQHYKDLEEQCRLVELPCKVGDTVWEVVQLPYLFPDMMEDVYVTNKREFELNDLNSISEYVFLTEEEAKSKIERLKGKYNG